MHYKNSNILKLSQFFDKFRGSLKKNISTLPKATQFAIDPIIEKELAKNNEVKKYGMTSFKDHFGRNVLKAIRLPSELESSINKVIAAYPQTNLIEDAKKLAAFIDDRRVPVEKGQRNEIKKQLIEDLKFEEEKILKEGFVEKHMEYEIEKKLKAKIPTWNKINFNERTAMLYLLSRFEKEYSSVYQILSEIKKKEESFRPKHVFDFGSGLGTVLWATNSLWETQVESFFNCDNSREMNSLAELIAKGGAIDKPLKFKNTTFKLNLPKSVEEKYDLVTSCFSLFEMPNRLARFEVLENLWSKVKDEGYLVLSEHGSKHGFMLINEAREFMLTELVDGQDIDLKQSAKMFNYERKRDVDTKPDMQIFSPCPHSFTCPMLNEGRSCRFVSNYWPLNIDKNNQIFNKQTTKYSYLVLKKSTRKPEYSEWPRLVIRNPEKHGKVRHSWACNVNGEIDHIVTNSKRCIKISRIVKYSKCGDNLPLSYERKTNDVEKK